jgi:hypothetical protein
LWEDKPGEIIKPILLSDSLLGSGKEDDPFLVYTAEELNLIGLAPCDWRSHFQLMADIDMSGFDGQEGRSSFNIIGARYSPFAGVFDGNGHTISHLSMEGTDCVGLFGHIGQISAYAPRQSRAHIRNIGVLNASVTASGRYVGGLIGLNSGGIISNCYSNGTVSGSQRVGGLVGENNGRIKGCFSSGTVAGDEIVGGLVGRNYGSITMSYSTGTVSGKYVGGLVGSGSHSGVATCFWDMESSGQFTSIGGTGLTTTEMQTANTYLEAGWDFVGETANGTDDIWWSLEGQDYPRLWWEVIGEN